MALYDLTQAATDSGSANSWNPIYSKTLGSGAVPDDNAFVLRCDLRTASGVTVAKGRARLNGVVLWQMDALPPQGALSVEVWRTGSSSGRVVATMDYDTGTTQGRVQWRSDITSGLAWGSGQSLVVEGYSDVTGGVVSRGAGVLK